MISENPESVVSQAKITGFIAEGYRLVLICSHQLDRAITPNTEDFKLLKNSTPIAIRTVSLESPIPGLGSWSALLLDLEEVVCCDEPLKIVYAPRNDCLRSAIDGAAIAPFSVQTQLLVNVEAAGDSVPTQSNAKGISPQADTSPNKPGNKHHNKVGQQATKEKRPQPLKAEIVQFDSKAIQLAFADSLDVTVQPRLTDILVKQDDRPLTVQSAFLSRARGGHGTALSIELTEALRPGADLRLAYQSTGQSICFSDGTPLTAFQSKAVVVPQIVSAGAIADLSNDSALKDIKASNESILAEQTPSDPIGRESQTTGAQAEKVIDEPGKARVIAFSKTAEETAVPVLEQQFEANPADAGQVSEELETSGENQSGNTVADIVSSNISKKSVNESLSELKTEIPTIETSFSAAQTEHKEQLTDKPATNAAALASTPASTKTAPEKTAATQAEALSQQIDVEETSGTGERKMTRRRRRRANLAPVGKPIPVATAGYDRSLYQSEVTRSLVKNIAGISCVAVVAVFYLLK